MPSPYELLSDTIHKKYVASSHKALTIPVEEINKEYNKITNTTNSMRTEAKNNLESALWDKYQLGIYFVERVAWVVPDTNVFPG